MKLIRQILPVGVLAPAAFLVATGLAMVASHPYSQSLAADRGVGDRGVADRSVPAPKTASRQAGAEHPVDALIAVENQERGVTLEPAPIVDDLTYLRRVYVDLIGRIPTQAEIDEFQATPQAKRRSAIVDQLLANERFADKWTAFFADMLRLRSNAEGGAQLVQFVHQAVLSGMPYDEMCHRLIATNGKVGYTPEVGFILGDNADPMALAGATSQVFLGVRIACAECHDHPFDVWKREDFYGFAAYFSRTKRVERRFKMRTLSISALEDSREQVLWPPPGVGKAEDRKPMKARFPFEISDADAKAEYIARLQGLRSKQQQLAAAAVKKTENDVDDLLESAAENVVKSTSGKTVDSITKEAKKDAANIKDAAGGYETSDLRQELADLITSPRNRFFSRALVNRVWYDLVGKGFVEPLDDFSEENVPSHPRTLDHLADEFVANGYDLRTLVRMIVSTNAYQRAHVLQAEEAVRNEMEANFLATPMRRMLSEVLFDSIVTAGHLFEPKHETGKNLKTVWVESRLMKQPNGRASVVDASKLAGGAGEGAMMAKTAGAPAPVAKPGYDLESAIETKFESVLAGKGDDDAAMVEKMAVKSSEELEAERMAAESMRLNAEYIDRFIRAIVDDNPKFASSYNMPSPAPDGHFLRVFGQPERSQLGETRDHNPSMRQALMMLNGRLTHEASRVGELEPLYAVVAGKKPDLEAGIRLAYREIFTREPSAEELRDAREVIDAGATPLEGMADLRWVMLNSNEFRFLP